MLCPAQMLGAMLPISVDHSASTFRAPHPSLFAFEAAPFRAAASLAGPYSSRFSRRSLRLCDGSSQVCSVVSCLLSLESRNKHQCSQEIHRSDLLEPLKLPGGGMTAACSMQRSAMPLGGDPAAHPGECVRAE